MYDVDIEAEACVLHCEVTNLVDEPARLTAWVTDRDALGYRELEFRAVSGEWFDPDGKAHVVMDARKWRTAMPSSLKRICGSK